MADLHPRVYWTSDRSTLVEEGDVRAAFLAYAEADPIPDEHLALLNRSARVEPTTEPTDQAVLRETSARPKTATKPTRKPKA
jgi:hypothetical protein